MTPAELAEQLRHIRDQLQAIQDSQGFVDAFAGDTSLHTHASYRLHNARLELAWTINDLHSLTESLRATTTTQGDHDADHGQDGRS